MVIEFRTVSSRGNVTQSVEGGDQPVLAEAPGEIDSIDIIKPRTIAERNLRRELTMPPPG